MHVWHLSARRGIWFWFFRNFPARARMYASRYSRNFLAGILRLPMTYSKLSRKYFRLETKSSKREAEKYLMQYTVERSTNTRARHVKRPRLLVYLWSSCNINAPFTIMVGNGLEKRRPGMYSILETCFAYEHAYTHAHTRTQSISMHARFIAIDKFSSNLVATLRIKIESITNPSGV